MEPTHRHAKWITCYLILLIITVLLVSCSRTQKTIAIPGILWRKTTKPGELAGELATNVLAPKVVFTSNGKFLVVDDTIEMKVYELPSGLQLNRITVSGFGEVIEWEIPSGRRVREYLQYTGPQGEIAAVGYSPDGTLLACAGQNGFLAVWDTKTGMVVKTFRVRPTHHSIYTLAFSSDSQLLATGGTEGTIRLWDANSLKAIRVISTKATWVQSLAFVPKHPILISGSGGGDYSANAEPGIHIWSLKDGSLIGRLLGHKDEVLSVVISHDGKFLASGGTDDKIFIWEVGSWKLLRILKADQGYVQTLLWSPDDQLLLSIGGTRTIKFWRMKE